MTYINKTISLSAGIWNMSKHKQAQTTSTDKSQSIYVIIYTYTRFVNYSMRV